MFVRTWVQIFQSLLYRPNNMYQHLDFIQICIYIIINLHLIMSCIIILLCRWSDFKTKLQNLGLIDNRPTKKTIYIIHILFHLVSGQVSRDQSPRIFLTSESGAAKMKRPVARHHPNRNSANLGSSTLQEDLLKLIGPDFDPTPRTVSRQNSKVTTSP